MQKMDQAYTYIANKLHILDSLNPIMAARLATNFECFSKCMDDQKSQISKILTPLAKSKTSSKNLSEILNKILN